MISGPWKLEAGPLVALDARGGAGAGSRRALCPEGHRQEETRISRDIQDPPGQGPVQPAVGDPASAGGLD